MSLATIVPLTSEPYNPVKPLEKTTNTEPRTALNIWSAWIPACSGPGRAGKDLQDTGISWILVGDTATSPSFQVQRLKF